MQVSALVDMLTGDVKYRLKQHSRIDLTELLLMLKDRSLIR
jgi:hypothetical protein